jgi:hypothetical protein
VHTWHHACAPPVWASYMIKMVLCTHAGQVLPQKGPVGDIGDNKRNAPVALSSACAVARPRAAPERTVFVSS